MPKIIEPTVPSNGRLVVSLCDYSGNWSRPFAEHGYTVAHFDLKHGDDCLDVTRTMQAICAVENEHGVRTDIVLMAPVCTDFSVSGAQWWPAKDADGRTEASVRLVRACLAIKDALRPRAWTLENPVGRINRLVPELGQPCLWFNPCDYGGHSPEPEKDAYTKKTGLWGCFTLPSPKPIAPVVYTRVGKNGKVYRGSWMWAQLGGKSERTKTLRSHTPQGFAIAFAKANTPL